jgi:hypothetical protein
MTVVEAVVVIVAVAVLADPLYQTKVKPPVVIVLEDEIARPVVMMLRQVVLCMADRTPPPHGKHLPQVIAR